MNIGGGVEMAGDGGVDAGKGGSIETEKEEGEMVVAVGLKGQRKRVNVEGKRWVEDRKEAVKEMNGGIEVMWWLAAGWKRRREW